MNKLRLFNEIQLCGTGGTCLHKNVK